VKVERAVILGAVIFATISTVRLFLGLSFPAWFIGFFGPAFAVFCTSAIIIRATCPTDWRFIVAISVLTPVLIVLWPVYLNLSGLSGIVPGFSFSDFIGSADFKTIATNALFALLAAFAAGVVVVWLQPNNSFKPNPLRGSA